MKSAISASEKSGSDMGFCFGEGMGDSKGKYVRPPGLETGDSVEMTELTRDKTLCRSNGKFQWYEI